MSFPLRARVRRLQDLVGRALGQFYNDRDPDRADHVIGTLKEAFAVALEITGRWPPERMTRASPRTSAEEVPRGE